MGWGFIVERLADHLPASVGTALVIVRARAVHGLGDINLLYVYCVFFCCKNVRDMLLCV